MMQALSARWGAQGVLLAACLSSSVAAGAEATPAHPELDGSGLAAEVEPESVSPAPEREDARRLFLEGSRHVEAGEWNLARSDYRRSFELYPSPSTLVNLALCETELGNHVEARLLLDRALALSASTGPRFETERQAAVQAERARLEREIARSTPKASSLPRGTPAPPRPPRRETDEQAEVVAVRKPSAPAPAPAFAARPASVARPYRVLWVGSFIAGGVALTTALVSTGVLLDASATLGDRCNSQGVCPTELAGTVERYETAARVTNVGLISGVAAGALGLAFLTLDGRSPKANLALQASPSDVRLRVRF